MKWTAYDKSQVTNLIIALKKAKFDVAGMEVMAFSEVFKWVNSLHDDIEKELAPKIPALVPSSVKAPEAPKPPLDKKIEKKKKQK